MTFPPAAPAASAADELSVSPEIAVSANSPSARTVLNGTAGSLLMVNVAAAVMGGLLLAGMIAIRPGIGRSAFPLLYGLALLYLVADTVYWMRRGVHAAALDGDTLHVYRGRDLRHEAIAVREITDVHLHRRLSRRSLQILLGATVMRVPGATFYPGRKVWITSDAFDLAEFDRFADAVQALRPARG